ncbi:glycine betaine uptake BCCT transporter [Planococcus halocryophilus]|uniref:Glycine/betaine ABC transporter permease n=1 Tax=Planococcus halocryophilus TaxID=1215089 RepID=A0A1C7DMV7_9BACL|nr:BCCT family transporter [Planococcus halocryophilus]ANU12553.1 glycine/betaine ABC transporter permease [Planococcus halocryophilus]
MKKVTNVFWIALALALLAIGFGAFAPDSFAEVTGNIKTFLTTSFGWYYLLIVSIIVLFCLFFLISPMGQIKLGKDSDKPEFSFGTWIAMLFSAGMGIGLVFWGAAEPISHFAIDPATAEPGSAEAMRESMRFSFFHWGIHAWAIYAVVALALAYSQFRKGEPGLISATLKPIFGDKMKGPWGTFVDIIAVFATVVGVATTLGFGAIQINGGLAYLFDGIQEDDFVVQLIIIAIVTVLFMISAWSGLSKGIKYLSNANMVLAIALLGAMIILGPTLLIMNMFTDTIGTYFQNIVQMSFRAAPIDGENRSWIDGWTIFYWAWWISWSPFVGVFIARVSRGRTIRQFLLGVLMIPAFVSFLWFAAFGTTAIDVQQSGVDLTGLLTEQTLFAVFNELPFGVLLSVIAVFLITTFFVTSADSATFVLGMQTTGGSLYPQNSVKLTWGVAQSAIAVILLSTGGLDTLQTVLIIVAFPFSIIILLMMTSFYKAVTIEYKAIKRKR